VIRQHDHESTTAISTTIFTTVFTVIQLYINVSVWLWERPFAVAPAWTLEVAPLRVGCCCWLMLPDWLV
jgi:hypothetical protein